LVTKKGVLGAKFINSVTVFQPTRSSHDQRPGFFDMTAWPALLLEIKDVGSIHDDPSQVAAIEALYNVDQAGSLPDIKCEAIASRVTKGEKR
jgi:hypothetical protein